MSSIFTHSQRSKVRRRLQVLTSDEVMKEVSFRKQLLDRGLLLVLRASKEKRGPHLTPFKQKRHR